LTFFYFKKSPKFSMFHKWHNMHQKFMRTNKLCFRFNAQCHLRHIVYFCCISCKTFFFSTTSYSKTLYFSFSSLFLRLFFSRHQSSQFPLHPCYHTYLFYFGCWLFNSKVILFLIFCCLFLICIVSFDSLNSAQLSCCNALR